MFKKAFIFLCVIIMAIGVKASSYSITMNQAIDVEMKKLQSINKAGVYPIKISFFDNGRILTREINITITDNNNSGNNDDTNNDDDNNDSGTNNNDTNNNESLLGTAIQDKQVEENKKSKKEKTEKTDFEKNQSFTWYKKEGSNKNVALSEFINTYTISFALILIIIFLVYMLRYQYSKTEKLIKSTISIFFK